MWAVLGVLVVQVVWVVLVVQVVGGSTTRRIAVALPMGIVERRTDLVVRLVETRCLIVKPARGSRSADRAAIYPAIVLEVVARAIDREDLAEATDPEEPEGPGELVEAIVVEAQAVETVVHLGAGQEGTTEQAHAPTAAEVPPAWDLEAVVAAAAVAVVAADGGGRHGRQP
jgi:hypothetical protein